MSNNTLSTPLTPESLQKFRHIEDLESFDTDERSIVLYLESLKKDSVNIKDLDIYVKFDAKDFSFYVKNKIIYLDIPPNFPDYLLKFEFLKIDYLLHYPAGRTIYGLWPSFYKYENLKSQFFYLIGLISILALTYIFSATPIGSLVTITLVVFILIYGIFLGNLFFMVLYIGMHSRCFNETCVSRAKRRYCTRCEIFLRKNPFILMGVPKIIFNDRINDAEPEFELFFKLIIYQTKYIKKFKRIIYKFNLYNRHRIIDPFTLTIIISKNSSLKNVIINIFSLDLYLAERNYRTKESINLYRIPRISEEKARNFIQKYYKSYKIVASLGEINQKFPELINYNTIDRSEDIREKIKKIAKLKIQRLIVIDKKLANKIIKKIDEPEFKKLLL
ncbi:MAG: hypothetical protein GF329_21845 [Candidatus Lokiarchaeota archaeon]|nr:hypothetical protein [Candidatus Lokiarchaeota archaeon]